MTARRVSRIGSLSEYRVVSTLHLVPEDLRDLYEVREWRNAAGVLSTAYPAEWADIQAVLRSFKLPKSQILAAGGNRSDLSKAFDGPFTKRGWIEKLFRTGIKLDETTIESPTHKIDCYKNHVALEIEWNNKDPFFDRDLENFKRLHADGAISLGVIITRGAALQDGLKQLVHRFADEATVNSFVDVERIGLSPTRRQRTDVMKRVERRLNPVPFRDAWVDGFVGDKFGASTTHWRKLEDRVQRGVGNPCPLLLIGLPASVVTD